MSTINCKTHMKVWKERLEDYENLRVFGTKMKVGVQEEWVSKGQRSKARLVEKGFTQMDG